MCGVRKFEIAWPRVFTRTVPTTVVNLCSILRSNDSDRSFLHFWRNEESHTSWTTDSTFFSAKVQARCHRSSRSDFLLRAKGLAMSTPVTTDRWAGQFDCDFCRRKRLVGDEFSKKVDLSSLWCERFYFLSTKLMVFYSMYTHLYRCAIGIGTLSKTGWSVEMQSVRRTSRSSGASGSS